MQHRAKPSRIRQIAGMKRGDVDIGAGRLIDRASPGRSQAGDDGMGIAFLQSDAAARESGKERVDRG